ncbi:MAG: serine/threonine protein kinase, partial [Clostridia bacterium]|nr:serine/threonine protein kinase [Clostridia bacterium]
MIGKILGGRYEIIEEIGKGGMAYVYKAKCVLLNRIVAVKILRDDLDGGDEFLERFNTEAQAAASLSHSNIVSIFDVGIDHGKHYIVMEYVGGITLKEYIVEKGKIPYKEALDISYQICDAMQAAHEKNIVHRDIKPHNILVTDDRNVKVTDFGIARSGTTNTISGGNDILGSVHYISPEQAKGETVDTRSDLYSLGIVLYEMLTGKVPFDSDTPVAVAMMQIEQEAPAIYDSDIPRGILQIMYKAMCKDKNKRYQNAEEIKNDILSIIENEDFLIPDGDNYYKDYDYSSAEEKYVKLGLPMKTAMVILGIITSFILVASAVGIYNWVSDMSGSPTKFSASDKVPDVLGL